MADTLEEKIAQRIKQAEDREIYFKAKSIAEYLGFGSRQGSDNFSFGYSKNELDINYSGEGGYVGSMDPSYESGWELTIKSKNKTVFEESSGHLRTYIPGTRTWEKQLNELYPRALDAKEKKKKDAELQEKQQKSKELSEQAKKFGI